MQVVRAKETESELILCRFVSNRTTHHNIRRPRNIPFKRQRPILKLRTTPTSPFLTVNSLSLVNMTRQPREAGLQAGFSLLAFQ
jgi:hypothetical protein